MLNLTNIALFNFLIPFLWRHVRPKSCEANSFSEHCKPVFENASFYLKYLKSQKSYYAKPGIFD